MTTSPRKGSLKKEADALANVPAVAQPEVEELSIEEIKEKFQGDWVGIRVTLRDEMGQPIKGVVLAHDVNRTQLRNMLNDVLDCCIFSTKPPLPVMF